MKRRVGLPLVLLLVTTSSFLAGHWLYPKSSAEGSPARGRRVLYYVDPMHPAYKSDKPGIAPDCGMQLEPVYADGAANATVRYPVGTVHISTDTQQLMGVRVAAADGTGGRHEVRILGRVAADENRIYRLNSAVEGWMCGIGKATAGSFIRKDERLAAFYSPEFYSAQQAYFYALGAVERFRASGMDSPEQSRVAQTGVQTSSDSLRNLGMSDVQIAEIAKTRQIVQDIWVVSPVEGVILARNISLGQRFEKGTEFYKIADLSRVWIVADAFENEAQYFRPGGRAHVSLPYQQKSFTATVSDVPPQFDPATRTLKIRLEADNPGVALRPDMFVDVTLTAELPAGISVPLDAVIDSGMQKRVFVDTGDGYFQPREVKTGWRQGDRVQIVHGLQRGERVVVSGTFLVDSESRLKAAAAGISSRAVQDPVCGMETDQQRAVSAGRTSVYAEDTFYFCSDDCKRKFEQAPARYAHPQLPAPSTELVETKTSTDKATDLTCGMTVSKAKARAGGLTHTYRGATYYFCSSTCKQEFEKDPEKYLDSRQQETRP